MNEIFPIHFPQHVLLVVVATVVFLLQYARMRYKYQLLLSFIPPLTMLSYSADTRMKSAILSIIEVSLCTAAIILAAKERMAAEREKKRRKAQMEQEAAASYTLEESASMTDQESWSAEPLTLETQPEQNEEKPSEQESL